MKLVDALVQTLRAWDVKYIFGVSGANIEHLHDALIRLNDPQLQSVLAKSETGAAFMADARARTQATLGVCCATSGGGMMNLAAGLAESHADAVPVLAIVGQIPTHQEGRGGFQDSSGIGRTVDALGLFRSMTKYVVRVDKPELFWEQLHAAVEAALTGIKGPACLLIPRDLYDREVPEPPANFPRDLRAFCRPTNMEIERVRQIDAALSRAKRPVIIVGREVYQGQARNLLIALAIARQVPVATTMASLGAFPNDSALYLGCVGAAGHPSTHDYINDTCDLIVTLGTDLALMSRVMIAKGLARANVIVVGENIGVAQESIGPAVAIHARCEDVLRELLKVSQAAPLPYRPKPLRRYVQQRVDLPSLQEELLQSRAIDILQRYLPARGHAVFDAGNCAAAAMHGLRLPSGCMGTIALGMGAMGYGIAGAVGAQLGAPEGHRTIALCGDGAFLMLGYEVHTCAELGLQVLFIVFNNGGHGMCTTRQRVYFDARLGSTTYARADIAANARSLAAPDRLWVARASSESDMRRALDAYFEQDVPTGLLELNLQGEEMPPFAPFLPSDAETYLAD